MDDFKDYDEVDAVDDEAYDYLRATLTDLPLRPGTQRGVFQAVAL